MSAQPNETAETPVDPLADYRLTMREAKVLFRRSRSGVPGLARVLAESLEEVLARYDEVVTQREVLRARLEGVERLHRALGEALYPGSEA